jgi:hypothetical protein
MRSSTSLLFFAGSAAAQSSVAIFNLFEVASTLTLVGSDATATTYKNDCPTSNAGLSGLNSQLPSSLRKFFSCKAVRLLWLTNIAESALPTPAPTARALLKRQALSDDPNDEGPSLCEPYTIKQGASTWEMHLTDPSPGLWTVNMNCNWQGAMTAADFTCTATVDGSYVDATDRTVDTTVMSSASVSEYEAINTVAIVDASQTPLSSGATPTASRSGASGSGPVASGSGPVASGSGPVASGSGASRSGASGSPSGAAATPSPSTGFAPAGPLPTGAMALVGGAVGVFAAALAL